MWPAWSAASIRGPGVGLEGERLDVVPDLRGDDEQRRERIEVVDGRGDRRRVGRVEDAQVEPAGRGPERRSSTSGARLLPPIPATIAAVKPASRMPSPNPSSAAIWPAKWSGASSQPRRSSMAAWTRGSVVQSEASLSNSRSAQRSSRARATAAS